MSDSARTEATHTDSACRLPQPRLHFSSTRAANALDAKRARDSGEPFGFYKGRTVVVVAHRLYGQDADRIVVLDGGRVVETGTHSSLIDKKDKASTL